MRFSLRCNARRRTSAYDQDNLATRGGGVKMTDATREILATIYDTAIKLAICGAVAVLMADFGVL